MKLAIKLILFVSLLTLLVFGYGSTFGVPASAETVPQMRLRVIEEARQQHPDVWANCNAACVELRLGEEGMRPIFTGLAKQANVDLGDLVRFSIIRDYEWGLSFEKDNKRPPNPQDWKISFAPRMERLRYELASSPVIFQWVQEEPEPGRLWRLKHEFGGFW